MNTRELERAAKAARNLLLTQCEARLNFVLSHENDPIFAADGAAIRELKSAKRGTLIEKAAYTWFNRFMAFRFMDVHGFNRPLVLSPVMEGGIQPQLLSDALEGITPQDLPNNEKKRVLDLLLGRIPSPDAQAEVYRLLFLHSCRTLKITLPFLFEEVDKPVELLLPDDLLSEHSVPALLRSVMDQDSCRDVEIIGWLFQFYISDKKDAVMAKGGAVSSEDLPARTQLFTPEWIVRYLVENSLGRLWLENHPESQLTDHMRYYIPPQKTEASSQLPTTSCQPTDVENIRLIDPACGSGHILVYAFELLTHIYEEEGYAKSQIPEMILRNNLYGLEIDPRAGQLAAFALVMKACLYDRNFLRSLDVRRQTSAVRGGDPDDLGLTSNICVLKNIRFTANEQQNYQKRLGKSLITQDLWLLMKQFENAETLGSLIMPKTAALRDIEDAINASGLWDDLLLHETNKKLKDLLTLARMLSPRYHVVVTNPPYLGNAYLSPEQKQYGADHFPNGKSDLFAMFFERGYELTLSGGYMGYMSPYVWMFIQSYESLRRKMIEQKHITSLVQMEYSAFAEATVPLCTFVLQNSHSDQPGDYFRLTEFKGGMEVQKEKYLEAVENPKCGWFYRTKAENFSKISGSPIAYWFSDNKFLAFQEHTLKYYGNAQKGLDTCDVNRFVRFWFEIEFSKIGFHCKNNNETYNHKWFPYAKGGEYRRWYGNNWDVVLWEDNGKILRNFKDSNGKLKSRPQNTEDYFKKLITWSAISSSKPSMRFIENSIYGGGGTAFIPRINIYYCLSFLNSKIAIDFLKAISPTLNYEAGHIMSLPLIYDKLKEQSIQYIATQNISLSKNEWDSFETSWNFVEHPLAKSDFRRQTLDVRLEDCWLAWQQECEERFQILKANEEDLNRIFIDIYGLQDELTPEVDEKDVTVRRADLRRECRSLVSYAIGCIFGRYSLDKPGLQFAGGPDDGREVPAVLPLSEETYSKDDAAELVQQFLKDAYGEKYYAENLRFLEAGLGKDLRSYLCNDFYADHLKIYQKRPIYWLFQSPKGSFKALIYLHRYVPGRAADVLALCRELEARYSTIWLKADATESFYFGSVPPASNKQSTSSKAEQRKQAKETEKANQIYTELKTWEKEVLAPLAEQRLLLDLDDGVKVNYAKFGAALAKIK